MNLTRSDASRLYAYTRWACGKVLDSVESLTAGEFTRAVGGSFGSVQATLAHLWGADWVWLERWHGRSPAALPDPKKVPTVATLDALNGTVISSLTAFEGGFTGGVRVATGTAEDGRETLVVGAGIFSPGTFSQTGGLVGAADVYIGNSAAGTMVTSGSGVFSASSMSVGHPSISSQSSGWHIETGGLANIDGPTYVRRQSKLFIDGGVLNTGQLLRDPVGSIFFNSGSIFITGGNLLLDPTGPLGKDLVLNWSRSLAVTTC